VNIATQDTARNPQTSRETVLVVEDSKAEQQRLHAMLLGFGYRVLTADNGEQALEVLDRTPIGLILSDWRMPKLSGIELCRAVRDDPELGQPYVILLTGQDTKKHLVAGMDAGADDFISKPFTKEELRVRVQAGMRLQELRRQSEQRSEQLAAALQREESANSLIQQDLATAARMQRESLPSNASPFAELEIDALYHAATTVAGDSYNFFRLDAQHLAFYLIDVAGHGVAAAMLSFTVSRFLSPQTGAIPLCRDADATAPSSSQRLLDSHIVPPDKVVQELNRRFVDKMNCEYYFTMIYGVLNVETGCGELCQAGHPHPLIVASEDRVTRVGAGGFPVGMIEQASYESVAFRLERGDRLFMYSDGITDCRGKEAHPFGEQRLAALLGEIQALPLAEGIARIDQSLQLRLAGTTREDDMSLVAIARLAVPTKPIKLLTTAENIPDIAERVARFSARSGLHTQACFQVQVIVAEALNNLVSHGFTAPVNEPIQVECELIQNRVEITIRDRGQPFEALANECFPHAQSEHGRGWAIINAWADHVQYRAFASHNELTLTKRVTEHALRHTAIATQSGR
jgi:sigma-B regulation protein RsbU (phosphoserine phosphatase)